MSTDSVRMLTDSAGHLWRELSAYGAIDQLATSDCFEDWLHTAAIPAPSSDVERQVLQRAYRRLRYLLAEIEMLVHSRNRACDLVRARASEGASRH